MLSLCCNCKKPRAKKLSSYSLRCEEAKIILRANTLVDVGKLTMAMAMTMTMMTVLIDNLDIVWEVLQVNPTFVVTPQSQYTGLLLLLQL